MEYLPVFGERHRITQSSKEGRKIFDQLYNQRPGYLSDSADNFRHWNLHNTLNSLEQQTPLKIVNDHLVLQVHAEKKEAQVHASEGFLLCYNYATQNGFEIQDGVLFVSSFDCDK